MSFISTLRLPMSNQRILPLFIFFFIFCCIAQMGAAAEDSLQYSIQHFTNENGLPQNSVKSIAADEYGFVWLATESGVVRFDGRHFKLFNKRNTGLLTSRIVSIEKSPADNQLYAISDSWQLLRIQKGAASAVKDSLRKLFQVVYDPVPSGSIIPFYWKYSGWHDSYKLDSLSLTIAPGSSVVLSRNGMMRWFSNKKNIAVLKVKPFTDLINFFVLNQHLYLLPKNPNDHTLYRFNAGTSRKVMLLGDILHQRKIEERVLCGNNVSGTVFIYADKHFYEVNVLPDGNLDTRLLLDGFDFKKEQIVAGYYDKERQRLFLGSAVNGLFVLNFKHFKTRTITAKDGLNNVFYEQIAFNDNSILSGRGVLLSSEHNTSQYFPQVKAVSNNYGSVIIKARDNTIWTADLNTLYQHTADLSRIIRSWVIPFPFSINEGENGVMWLGTNRHGIYRIDSKKKDVKPELFFANKDYIICLAQESPEVLWAGSEGNLFRINIPSQKAETIPELTRKIVRGLYIPHPGEVWICTYEDGFYLYRNGKLTHFPLDKNEYLNTVHKILEDKNGFFWISTNNGLFQVLKKDLMLYADGKTEDIYYQHYGKDAGFNTNEFNGGSIQVGVKLKNGYFSFSSMNGVVFFNPLTIKADLPDRAIVVDAIEIDGREWPVADTLKLNMRPDRINIRLASPYFGNAANIQFAYKIENKDGKSEWIAFDNEVLGFTSLPSGENRIVIRKKAGFGGNKYSYKTVVADVPFPWWETLWFRVFVLLQIAVLIGLFVKLRLKYLQRKTLRLENEVALRTAELEETIGKLEVSENELGRELHYQKRLNENIAHDINTPLKYLTLTTKYLLQRVRNNETATVDEVAQIHEASQHIYLFTKKLVSYMKLRLNAINVSVAPFKIKEMFRGLAALFNNAAAEKNVRIINMAADGIEATVHRELVEIVMHNLLDNAIKHTNDGTISLDATTSGQSVVLSISDTGQGMSAEQLEQYNYFFNNTDAGQLEIHSGLGYRTIKDILPLIEATLTISKAGISGTRFVLNIKQGMQL